jgi:hypothetical protein
MPYLFYKKTFQIRDQFFLYLDPVVGVLCPVMVQLKNYFNMLRWDALVSQPADKATCPGPSRRTGCMEQNAERVYNVSDKYYPLY